MSPETKQIPDWATQERQQDMAWIGENLNLFWQTASMGARLVGRGAIFVDVEARPMGSGNLFSYFTQTDIEQYEDEDINRLVAQYEPDTELVVVLLKPEQRTSSYRVRLQPHQPVINHNHSISAS